MNLSWYLKRLQAMSVKEILDYRVPQFFRTKIFMRWPSFYKDHSYDINPNYKGPQYNLEKLIQLFDQYPFHHNYELFHTVFDIMEIQNWRKDIHSGIVSREGYFGSIKRQAFDKHGDVKIIAEISRLHFLPYLAYKHITNPKDSYLERIKEILVGWDAQNPYLHSINWTSGIEIGIRSVNLIYTHHILKQFGVLQKDFDLAFCQLISTHYHFLKRNLSKYSSANNHLMAELMGLICIGSYLNIPKQEDVYHWEDLFYEQVEKQVLNDGVHMELCTRYHSEVLDHILIATSFLENTNRRIPQRICEHLRSMFDFVSHVTYKGAKCIFGDNDEGSVIYPFFDKNFSLYQSQLASSNYKFETTYACSGKIDFRNYVIYGIDFREIFSDNEPDDAMFPVSGYFFSYDHANKMKLSFDVGPIGDNILAAHGHSDIFHFSIAINGLEFLIDPGTFQYHTKYSRWRDYFRGISAHNTISINGKEHAKKNGRMSWIACLKVDILHYDLKGDQVSCEAETNAFSKEGVTHSRAIYHKKSDQKVHIIDSVINQSRQEAEAIYYLHFHPEVEIEHQDDQLILHRKTNRLIITNDFISEGEIYTGNSDIPLGWYSPKFGVMLPANTFRFRITSKEDLKIKTEIRYA